MLFQFDFFSLNVLLLFSCRSLSLFEMPNKKCHCTELKKKILEAEKEITKLKKIIDNFTDVFNSETESIESTQKFIEKIYSLEEGKTVDH